LTRPDDFTGRPATVRAMMRPTSRLRGAALLTFLSASLLTEGLFAQEQDLSLTTTKGTTVWLVEKVVQKQQIDAGGQQMETANTVNRTLKFTVLDVAADGDSRVRLDVLRIHGSVSVPMLGDATFDSAEAGAEDEDDDGGMGFGLGQMKKQMARGAGHSGIARIGKDGKVKGEVEGVEDTKTKLGKADLAALKATFEGVLGRRPDGKKAAGATWAGEHQPSGSLPVLLRTTETLQKVDADAFEITSEGTVEKSDKVPTLVDEGDEEAAASREMLESMKIGSGKAKSTRRVSRKDGFVVESSTSVTLAVEMETPMGDMKMDIETATTISRTTAEAAMPKPAEKGAEKAAEKAAEKGR
jgi:hypothetical protein